MQEYGLNTNSDVNNFLQGLLFNDVAGPAIIPDAYRHERPLYRMVPGPPCELDPIRRQQLAAWPGGLCPSK